MMTSCNTRMTNTMMVMSSVVGAASLGLTALLAAGCAGLDGEPTADPELAGAEHEVAVTTYSRWDYVPYGGSTHQLRVIGNADGRLAMFSRTPGGQVQLSQQVAVNGGWTTPAPFDGSSSPDMEVARELDGRLAVFALGGGDRAVYYRTQTAAGADTFTPWANLGAGTSGATDMEVGQHADGRLVVFILGADRTIWARTQATPGGGFGSWESHGGATSLMRVTSQGGRIALASYSTVGTFYVKEQPVANGAFGGWSFAGQHALTDFDVTRLTDGRLHLAWVTPTDAQRALRASTQGSTGGWIVSAVTDTGPYNAIELLERPGASAVAFATATGGHAHMFPLSSSGSYASGAYDIAGANLVDLAAGVNQDGRLEVFGRNKYNSLLQTWQIAPGLPGSWRPLPATAPTIDLLSAMPTAPLKNNPVDINWRLGAIPAGCTPTFDLDDDNGGFYGMFSLTSGTAHDDIITKDTTYTATASCTELERSGVNRTTIRTLLVRLGTATTPPGVYETTFGLFQDTVYSGPITHSALVLPYSTSSTLLSLWYGSTLGSIKLLPPSASNYDCENPSAGVNLLASTWATPAQIAALYGTSTPAMPVVVRACSSAFMTVRYDYHP